MKYRVIKNNNYKFYKYFPQYLREEDKLWHDFEVIDCGEIKTEQFNSLNGAKEFILKQRKKAEEPFEVVWEEEM